MKHKKKLIEAALPLDAKRSGLESHCRLLTSTVFTTVAGRASEGPISAWRAEPYDLVDFLPRAFAPN